MVLTAQQWLGHIHQFEASDLTQREYTQAHNLNIHTFRSQLYRARQSHQTQSELRLVPLELQVSDHLSQAPALRFELGDFSLCFEVLPDPSYLASLMRALVGQDL